jgi:hypothetical protein
MKCVDRATHGFDQPTSAGTLRVLSRRLGAFDDWCAPFGLGLRGAVPHAAGPGAGGQTQMAKLPARAQIVSSRVESKTTGDFCRADQFCGPEAATAAKSVLAVAWQKCCRPWKRNWPATARSSPSASNNIPITPSSLHCPVPARSWLPGCWVNWSPCNRWRTCRKPCNVWRAWLRSAISRARCPSCICATNATGFLRAHHSPVGGFEPALLRLGAHLLRSPPEKRPEPRLRLALPGNALAQNHRGHDPQPDAL